MKRRGSLGAPVLKLLFVTVINLLVAVVLAYAYSYVIVYMPFVYFSIVAPIGLGAIIGFIVMGLSLALRIRSIVFLGLLGMLSGGVAVYMSWAVDRVARLSLLMDTIPQLREAIASRTLCRIAR